MPNSRNRSVITIPPDKRLHTLIENRRIFNLDKVELSIFDTCQTSYCIPFVCNEFVISQMIKGKKKVNFLGEPVMDYMPGETLIIPPNETLMIDFPEASMENPTQCIALAVSEQYIDDTIDYLNEHYNSNKEEIHHWRLNTEYYHFFYTQEMVEQIGKIAHICMSDDKAKDIYADLRIKELLIRLMQHQNREVLTYESKRNSNSSSMHHVLNLIHENITEKISIDHLSKKAYLSRNVFFKKFKEEIGVTPVEYINVERVRMAKYLLATAHELSVAEISVRCGFSDANYFIRMFKKIEGLTPKAYQLESRQQKS
ncbi:MAG: AraC family transcriptional regulator [Filimonas sp.]|nr:AraC family transcriptional regulator [Filimonas sp.]